MSMAEMDKGESRVEEKFAERGHAELFHAQVTW